MKPLVVLLGLLGALLAPAAPAFAAAPAKFAPSTIEVTLDQSQISAAVGDTLTLESSIVNNGPGPTDPLVAHLNVASLDGSYVDLEDWSADVTRSVASLAPGSSTSLSWEFQAVNTGSFDVYVVVLPTGASTVGPLVASPPVHVTVAGRRTLSAGGALPVVIVIPVLLGLAAAATLYRTRLNLNRRS